MKPGSIQQRLFSRATVIFLFIVIGVLLSASFYTYVQDRKLQSVSLSALKMASWNLARMSNEAGAFDREVALMAKGVGDPEEFMLRFDVLWSRYDYLLNSAESMPTRQHQDNLRRIKNLFSDLKGLEPQIKGLLKSAKPDWSELATTWERQRKDIQLLLADNFVGEEASQLMTGMESSRMRLANLRLLMLGALVVVFVYLAFAITHIRRQSRTDPLTGLPNSNYLQTINSVDPRKNVIVCQIRDLGLVIAEYGNETVHEVVQAFARKLEKGLGGSDELIQISQGEFLLLVKNRKNESSESLAARFIEATTFEWRVFETVIPIQGVFGVAVAGKDQSPVWSVRYQEAYRALAMAQMEREQLYISNENLEKRLRDERIILNGLVRFLSGEPSPLSLSVVYQPIVDARNQNFITGAEVLLRCRDRVLGFVPPNVVVDLSERHGLGADLGKWLFRQVAKETSQLYRDLGFRGSLSINLNPAMLSDSLVSDVQGLLVNEGIPASALCMEITEDNAALDFERINELINELHTLGVTFALDDFGTGHSSLEYVRELKVDRLKVDRCFVNGIEHSEDKLRFLGSIVAMAEQVYMKTVIEGVENQAQWDLIEKLGDVLIQGYFAHKPMPFNEFMAVLMDAASRYPTTRQLSVSAV
ncbi:MAG TPA: GGDEF domain-containing protein [Marinobacter adhaerens]|uniref:GGDEF domain-containing protein n=1 Tax=Marinobacter adhaerens TaxID=1033846 RepID=A0A352IUM6_9GAMM|nr:GGDEF domain-containing protein [Marinobacter adhaerens]